MEELAPPREEVEIDARATATTAAWLGVISLVIGLFWCIGSCISVFLSAGLGGVAIAQARKAQAAAPDDELVQPLTTLAMVAGGASVGFATLYFVLIFAYFALYAVMLVAVVASN